MKLMGMMLSLMSSALRCVASRRISYSAVRSLRMEGPEPLVKRKMRFLCFLECWRRAWMEERMARKMSPPGRLLSSLAWLRSLILRMRSRLGLMRGCSIA